MRDQILELKWSLEDIYGHANSKSIAKVQAYNPHPYYPEEVNTFSAYHKPTVAWKRRFMHHVLNASLTKTAECCIIAQVQNLCEAFVGSVSEVQEDGWSKSFDMGEWSKYSRADSEHSLKATLQHIIILLMLFLNSSSAILLACSTSPITAGSLRLSLRAMSSCILVSHRPIFSNRDWRLGST